ncbi:MAG: helix-turn-helix domain-containing protein [Planctomycetaceae bacterium]
MKKTDQKKSNYVERINRVLDAIYSDLTQSFRLQDLAIVADLSPFHFHRVFQAIIGETPADFIKRLRLERALHLMAHGKRKSLTTIAIDCGFSCSSDFTRSFKQRYGVAPSHFDLEEWQSRHSNQISASTEESPFRLERPLPRSNPDRFRVNIRELPARSVAYLRVDDPYHGDAVVRAAERLVKWAEERGLAEGQWLGYQFENPNVTALEDCHYHVAVEVEHRFQPQGEIGRYRFPSMLVADVPMKGDIYREIRLFRWLYGSWLPRSNYVPADLPSFEAWNGKPFEHGLQHFELSVQLPIR